MPPTASASESANGVDTGAIPRPDLPTMDRVARLERIRERLVEFECDAVVVTKPENVRWLTGFTGSNGTVVLRPDRTVMVTDARYTTQVELELDGAGVDAEIAIDREGRTAIVDAVGAARRVGLESEHVTWGRQRQIAGWLPEAELVALPGVLEQDRRIKDDGEIARLKAAAGIADRALAEIRGELAPGRTERSIARRLDAAMLAAGADDLSFPTIVAAGPNSAKPHARPSDRAFEAGDLLVMDFGAKVDGYGSDMTRSFVVGGPGRAASDPEGDRRMALFRAVEEAQAAGVAAVRAGVAERDIDEVCRTSLAGHGLADAFLHGTGHGIGLEIHENPILSARASGILRSGYVVTVEPGAYLPDVGGVRIEDSVVVTETGCEPITLSPKNPVP